MEKDLDLAAMAAEAETTTPTQGEVTYELAELPFDEKTRAEIDALHQEAFGGSGDWVYRYLEALPAATCWLALVDGKVVGLKMGAMKGPRRYHSHEGTVSGAYRRRGIARALMQRQHDWAREQGYRAITTNTYGRFRAMLRLNLEQGFDIIGTTLNHGERWPKLHLAKRLDGKPGFGPETYRKPA